MRIISLAINTTGDDPSRHQIAEIGAMHYDTATDSILFPYFRALVLHDDYVGTPEHLAKLAPVFDQIVSRDSGVCIYETDLATELWYWVQMLNNVKPTNKVSILLATSGIDMRFLYSLSSWDRHFDVVGNIDVRLLHINPEEDKLPSLSEIATPPEIQEKRPPILNQVELTIGALRSKLTFAQP